ncbi:hypothetical protein WG66_000340 [Moniliophthora roreri]|nr:hypothetical protein WG66_000340 [Moniliophthora roreri]
MKQFKLFPNARELCHMMPAHSRQHSLNIGDSTPATTGPSLVLDD